MLSGHSQVRRKISPQTYVLALLDGDAGDAGNGLHAQLLHGLPALLFRTALLATASLCEERKRKRIVSYGSLNAVRNRHLALQKQVLPQKCGSKVQVAAHQYQSSALLPCPCAQMHTRVREL